MSETVPIFENQYLLPGMILLSISTDLVFRKLNMNWKIVGLVCICLITLQCCAFFAFRSKNLYEELEIDWNNWDKSVRHPKKKEVCDENEDLCRLYTQYEKIVQINERRLFYEKYHSISEDLNVIRSSSYAQSTLMKNLNMYLMLLMVGIQMSQSQKFNESMSVILGVVLICFAYEASILVGTDLGELKKKVLFEELTLKENLSLVKMNLLSLIVLLKYVRQGLETTDHCARIGKRVWEVKAERAEWAGEMERELGEIAEVDAELQRSKHLLSVQNVHRVMYLSVVLMMVSGKHEL